MPRTRWLPAFTFAFIAGLEAASAQAPTLAGQWTATPLRAEWVIGDWGPACGPKPSGGGVAGGAVTIRQNGSELTFSGAGRNYSTTECWEQFPGLTRVSHSASARSFRNVCKTGPKDSRQATVITTISATDQQISFDETGQYQFVIEGQNCTASVRRSRFLKLVRREGEPEPAPVTEAPPAPLPAEPEPTAPPVATSEKRAGVCTAPGEPARLEVRPSRKLLRQGESFSFRSQVLDRAGCVLSVLPHFKLVGTPSGVELAAPGTLRVSEAAPEGEVKLLASIGDRSVSVVAEIVSGARYDALLGQGRFDALGESGEAAVTRIESGSIGARSTVLHDEGEQRKKIFIAVVGAMALLLGVVGFVSLRRARKPPPKSAGENRRPASAGAAPPRKAEPQKGMICPTCREEYPGDAHFCANDGNRLVPLSSGLSVAPAGGICPVCGHGYDPGVTTCPKHEESLVPPAVYATRQAQASVRKICPVCGAQFSGESQFCGNCGASLVPVN